MSRSPRSAPCSINPLTIPPVYYAAYRIGAWELHQDSALVNPAAAERFSSELSRIMFWIHQASGPIAIGVLTLAVAAAIVGYFGAALFWRSIAQSRFRKRRAQRQEAFDSRTHLAGWRASGSMAVERHAVPGASFPRIDPPRRLGPLARAGAGGGDRADHRRVVAPRRRSGIALGALALGHAAAAGVLPFVRQGRGRPASRLPRVRTSRWSARRSGSAATRAHSPAATARC